MMEASADDSEGSGTLVIGELMIGDSDSENACDYRENRLMAWRIRTLSGVSDAVALEVTVFRAADCPTLCGRC